MEQQKTTSLRTQSAWLLFAKVTGFGFALLLPLLVVRFLSQKEVGLYRESFLIIMNAATILPLGFSMSAYYYLSRETARRGAAILNILAFNFIVGGAACLALFFCPQLLQNLFQSEEITRLAPKIGVVIWLWIFSTFLETVAVANQEARTATAFIIFAQFSKTLLMTAAVIVFGTVESFLYAAMVQGALQTLILLAYLNSRFPRFWTDFRPAFFVEQLKYAVPFGLVGILWILQTDVHNYFVAHKFSEAEFAIYAYGCFQLPLIAMLSESVASVLISKMSELQARDDRAEMIRLTTRAMQKLAFFYFPLYAFLLITAQTFIVTLFTENYLASVPIFLINITLLPFGVLITDPIVRAYQELGKIVLIVRISVLILLLSTLYVGLNALDMRGMIAVAVGALLLEKFIAETIIIRRVGFGRRHFYLLKKTFVTALIAVGAGVLTYFFYHETHEILYRFGANAAQGVLPNAKNGTLNFIGGSLVLTATALVFAPVYLLAANYFGIIEPEEKEFIRRHWSFLSGFFRAKSAADNKPLTTEH